MDNTIKPTEGTLLRDYFAAMALQGLLSRAPYRGNTVLTAARSAYAFADAMMEERNKSALAKIGAGEVAPYEWDDVDTYGASSC